MGSICGTGDSDPSRGYSRDRTNTQETLDLEESSESTAYNPSDKSQNRKKRKKKSSRNPKQTTTTTSTNNTTNKTNATITDNNNTAGSSTTKTTDTITSTTVDDEHKEEDLLNMESNNYTNTNQGDSVATLTTLSPRDPADSSASLLGGDTEESINRPPSQSAIDRHEIIIQQQHEHEEQLLNDNDNNNNNNNEQGVVKSQQEKREIIGSIPDAIDTPPEPLDVANIGQKGFESDNYILENIQKEFASEYNTLKLEKNMFYRYVIGYRHIKNEKERLETTIECLNTYFRVHKELNFDILLNDPNRKYSSVEEMEGWPVYIYGQDKQGHVIIWDEIGSVDVKKLDKGFKGKDYSCLQLHRARLMRKVENLKRQNQEKYNEKHLYKHTMIFDLKHFSLSKHGAKERRGMCQKVIQEMTNMYPECVFRIYVLNAPGVFKAFYQILKLFMDPITADKTRVLGKNYLKELVKDIDIEMIPQKYGGKGVWQVQYSDVPKGWPQDAQVGM